MNLIEEEKLKIESDLKKIINIINDQKKISILTKVDFGNLSRVAKSYIKQIKPDIILTNYNRLNKSLFSRKILPDYLEDYKGSIIITHEKSNTLPENKLKLGCFELEVFLQDNKIIIKLIDSGSSSVNLFWLMTNNYRLSFQKFKKMLGNKVKVFEFDNSNYKLGTLKYLEHTKSDLLCIYDAIDNIKSNQFYQYKFVIGKSKTPLLIIKK